MSWGNIVCIETRLWAECFRSWKGQEIYWFKKKIQTGSGAHRARVCGCPLMSIKFLV